MNRGGEMPRARDPNRDKAFELYKSANGKIDLVEIASQLNVSSGTVRGWKSKDKWEALLNGTLQTKDTERSKRSTPKKKTKKEAIADEVNEVIENPELTDKQRLFCIYYIRCFNATKAYQKAYGCDYAAAVSSGSRLLRNAKVKAEILRLKQDKFNREFLSEEDIFQKYMDIAFADITDFLMFSNEEIEFKDDLGKVRKATISHVNVKNDHDVDGTIISEVSKGRDGVKIKLADRMKALQWLAEHMDMATEEQKLRMDCMRKQLQETNSGNDIVDDWIAAVLGEDVEDDE